MRKIYYILVFLFLVSCTSNTIYKKPKNLIPKDTMVYLLTDLYLANSANKVKSKSLQKKVKYVSLVYNKYKIDSLRFKNSNIYYLSKMDEYEILFKKVNDTLKNIQKQLKIKKDSLTQIKEGSLEKVGKPFSLMVE